MRLACRWCIWWWAELKMREDELAGWRAGDEGLVRGRALRFGRCGLVDGAASSLWRQERVEMTMGGGLCICQGCYFVLLCLFCQGCSRDEVDVFLLHSSF